MTKKNQKNHSRPAMTTATISRPPMTGTLWSAVAQVANLDTVVAFAHLDGDQVVVPPKGLPQIDPDIFAIVAEAMSGAYSAGMIDGARIAFERTGAKMPAGFRTR
jgi:hypothetical protein